MQELNEKQSAILNKLYAVDLIKKEKLGFYAAVKKTVEKFKLSDKEADALYASLQKSLLI